MPLIFPAGGSSGCRLETLVGRGGERDRIDRSTTFEGCLYSSFPDLRTQRPGVEWRWNGVEWALTQNGPPESGRGGGERYSSKRISRSPLEHPSPLLPCDNHDDCRFVFSFSLIAHDTRPFPLVVPAFSNRRDG